MAAAVAEAGRRSHGAERTLRAMLHREETGSGPPLVTVHGAWADGRHWTRFAGELDGFRAITYDRRGHGRSGGSHESVERDVEDLAELIRDAGGEAHVVGGSLGGSIALKLAAAQPDLFLSLAVHEPALPGLLAGTQSAPTHSGPAPDARTFAENSLGEGAWTRLTDDERRGFEDNRDAWTAEMADPGGFTMDTSALESFDRPLLVTVGGASPPFWRSIAEALPGARIETVDGAGHLPQLSHAAAYAEIVRSFASAAAARR